MSSKACMANRTNSRRSRLLPFQSGTKPSSPSYSIASSLFEGLSPSLLFVERSVSIWSATPMPLPFECPLVIEEECPFAECASGLEGRSAPGRSGELTILAPLR